MNSAFWLSLNLPNQHDHEGGTLTMKNLPIVIVILVIAIALFFAQIFIDHIIGLSDPIGEWVSDKQLGVLVINDDGTGFCNLGSGSNEPFTWEYVEGRKIEMNPYKTFDRIMTTYAQADPLTGVLQIYKTSDLDPKKITTVYTRKLKVRNALLP